MKSSVKIVMSILLVSIIFLSLIFTGCSNINDQSPVIPDASNENDKHASNKEKPVTLRFSWWGGDTRHQATLDAIDAYMDMNKNITIEAEYSGFSGYYQKLVTQLASENAPDVFQSDQGWTLEFYQRGDVFTDLNEYSALIRTDKISNSMLSDYCIMDEKLIVLPMGFNGTVFLYNKDLMAPYLKDGTLSLTWDEFIEIGRDMHEKDSNIYLSTNTTDGYVRFFLKPIIEQITNKISVQDDYTIGFNKEEMTKAFELMLQLFESGTAQPYDESVIYKDSFQDNPKWINGEIGGASIFFSNIDRETSGLNYEFDVDRIPILLDAKTSGQEAAPSLMMAIYNKSAHKDESAKFVNWFLNDTDAAIILATERGVPTNSEALSTLEENNLLSPIMAKAVKVSNENIGFKNSALEMNASVHSIIVEKMEKVIFKESTPEQAADELINDLTTRLEEMKSE